MKIRHLTPLLLFVVFSISAFAQADRTITKSFPLDRDGRVSIDTYKGSIDVEVWDKAEVSLEARIELRDGDDDDAQEAVDLVDIIIDASQGSFRVETSYDRLNRKHKSWGFWNNWSTELPSVHYTLRIPDHASLTVDDYKSSSRIAGLSADLTFETYKGDAVVKDHSGEVRLETYKGDIEIEYRDKAHASEFETYKGDIAVILPKSSGFDVRMDLGRRADLYTDFDIRERRRSRYDHDRRFDDSVNGGGPSLRFESTKGTIRIDSR